MINIYISAMGSLAITGQGTDGALQGQAGRNLVSYSTYSTVFRDLQQKWLTQINNTRDLDIVLPIAITMQLEVHIDIQKMRQSITK